MSRDLPARPSLEHLKHQARQLLRALKRGDPAALVRCRAVGTAADVGAKLADALHVIAREYGFPSWPGLTEHLAADREPADPLRAAVAAVQAGNAGRVRELLRQHAALRARINDPFPEIPFDGTALLCAVQRGDRALIDVLLEAGADINGRSHWWAGGFGVLDTAAPDLVPFLLERGARMDAHAAARLGRLGDLERIVRADPDAVRARGGDGQTPLHVAAGVEVARFLLDRGAEIDALDVDHESTPAQYLVGDRQDVARFLVDRGCRTDLLLVVALGDLERVRGHLDRDPACIRMSVTERWFPRRDPRSGGTIYQWTLQRHAGAHAIARKFGREEVFQLLMARSPRELQLAVACELGEEATLARLSTGPADPDIARALTDDERRRLPDAAQNDDLAAVRRMLAGGWPVDARGQHGGTALHWAAWVGNAAMVREILAHRPPLEATDHDFAGTPLGWALHASVHGWHPDRGNYAGTVEALLGAGAVAPALTDDLDGSPAVRAALRRHAARGLGERR